jgi:uncharacterized protein YqeY
VELYTQGGHVTIQERMQKEMVESMKSHAELRLGVLRMMKTAVKLKETEKRAPLDEAECIAVFSTLIKQRRDSAMQFRNGGREDMADKEEQEILVIDEYMPQNATDEEVAAAIDAAMSESGATSPKQMGVVMKAVQARLTGKRVDGKVLSEKVKAKLGAG